MVDLDKSLLKNGEIMYRSDNSIDFEPFPMPEFNLEKYTLGIDLAKGSDMTIYHIKMLKGVTND